MVGFIGNQLVRLAKIKRLLPKHANSRVVDVVAAMVIPDNVARYAYSKGLIVIGQSGEHLEISNDAGFQPTVW